MKLLVINAGSSSVKFQVFEMINDLVLVSGLIEKIGEETSEIKFELENSGKNNSVRVVEPIKNHKEALQKVAGILLDKENQIIEKKEEIKAVGHRVVHGGEKFKETAIINDEVKEMINELSSLAPLHNPPNLQGIVVATEVFPQAKQVAVFDTAFHQTMPAKAYRYAIPNKFYEEFGIRAYGMHGTSHRYVTKETAKFLKSDKLKLITIHLGNGCSMAAVRDGKCVDTTMGLTPLAGLVMGTRGGDIDPGVLIHLGKKYNLSVSEIDKILNKESGLKGLTGLNDMRDVLELKEKGDVKAKLALDVYTYRIKKYIGSYAAILGGLDAIVFTAGVGENSAYVREASCEGLEFLGISIDPSKNDKRAKGIRVISEDENRVKILVIPTNEELEIARQTFSIVQ